LRYDNIAINQVGDGIPSVNVAVCNYVPDTVVPCVTPNVALFSDSALTVPLSNPFKGDSLGNYGFNVAGGNYVVTLTGGASSSPFSQSNLITLTGGNTLLLQTNSTPNSSQSLLNLVAGSNTTLTDSGGGAIVITSTGGGGGGSGPLLETNGVANSSQTTLNLVAGGGISLNDAGGGAINISAPLGEGVTGPLPLVFNGDFEVAATLPPPGWDPNPAAAVSYETLAPYQGTQTLKMVSIGSSAAVFSFNQTAVNPGDTFLIQGAAKSDGVVTANISLQFTDALFNAIGPGIVANTAATSYQFISAQGTAPVGSVYAIIQLFSSPLATLGTTWFDAIAVYKTSLPGNYTFSGSVRAQQVNGVVMADQMPGSDACAMINNAFTLLASQNPYGGVVDARGIGGTNVCSTTLFAGYPTATLPQFSGVLLTAGLNLQVNAPIVLPTNLQWDGFSGDATVVPFAIGGTSIQPSATAVFQATSPLLSYGTGPLLTHATLLRRMRVSCLNPSGVYTSGSIGVQNLWSQELAGMEFSVVDGCTIGLDVESNNAQNSGPWQNLSFAMNNVSDATALAIRYGSTSGGSGPTRGFKNITAGGGGATVQINTLLQIDGNNVSLEDLHLEQATTGIEFGANHGANDVFVKNINCTSTAARPMTNCVDLSSAIGSSGLFTGIGTSGGGNVTNLLNDHQTNGGTIAITGSESVLALYVRNQGNQIISSSKQVPTTLSNYTFATLPVTFPNGSQVYCTDCNSTCTAGASTGRTCFREHGTWTH
jgi:hypothetical protein